MSARMDHRAALIVRDITIDRMEGIRKSFRIETFSPGINLVCGPNGIGKSRTATALQALLWPSICAKHDQIYGNVELSGDLWRVDVDGGRSRLQRNGVPESTEVLISLPDSQRDRYLLTLQDLLQTDNRDFAREIAREAAGGVDLGKVRDELQLSTTPNRQRQLVRELQEATGHISSLRQAHRRLAEKEASLAELRAEREEAILASGRVRLLESARKYMDALDSQAQARITLDQFPSIVRHMTGQEYENLQVLKSQLAEMESTRRDLLASIDATTRELAATGLQEQSVPATLIGMLREYLEQARGYAVAREQATKRIGMTSPLLEISRKRIAAPITDEQLSRLDSDGLRILATHVADLREAQIAVDLQEQLWDWLGPYEQPGNLDSLRQGINLLQQYIGLEQAATSDQSNGPRLVLLGSAGILIIEAIVLAITTSGWALIFALFAIPVVLLAISSRGEKERGAERLREEYGRLGVTPPSDWSVTGAHLRLTELQHDVASGILEEQKYQRWQALASKRDEAEARRRALVQTTAELREIYGVVAEKLDTESLELVAKALDEWRRAYDEDLKARTDYEIASRMLERTLNAINVYAEYFADGDVTDVSQTTATVDDLSTRISRAEGLMLSLERDQHQLDDELIPGIERLSFQISRIYTHHDVEEGDDAGLKMLCGMVEGFLQAQRALDDVDVIVKTRREELNVAPELTEASHEEIERQLIQADSLAARRDSIQGQISTIEENIRQARHETQMEQAIVREANALEHLAENRQREYAAVAGSRLLAMIQNRDRQQNRPAVFRVADKYFARFTSGAYRLTMSDDNEADLFALDTSTGAALALDQLSSGTRVQLLLAVRLAFIDVTERGAMLPIVLDEALGNTDDTRAIAIIDAMIEIAREGRQVLYFTAQHDEIGKWLTRLNAQKDAPVSSVIDLEDIRHASRTRTRVDFEWEENAFAMTPIEEGATYETLYDFLSVHPVDLWADKPNGAHIWYFIPDVPALATLHQRGIRLWGQYLALSRSGHLDGIDTGDLHARAMVRAQLIETVCREWRFGRPHPLTKERLDASGLITPAFWEEVVDCAEACEWDGAEIIVSLRNRSVSRFRNSTIDDLEEWFREHRHIVDDAVPQSMEFIRATALSAADAAVRSGLIRVEEIDDLLRSMTGRMSPATIAVV